MTTGRPTLGILIIDQWTEYERGWGSRPDGASVHMSREDHYEFVKNFNLQHSRRRPTSTQWQISPQEVHVPISFYDRVVEVVKTRGVRGMFISDEELDQLRNGIDPCLLVIPF